ncbi:ADP-heptose:LPS heptosyltransferase [Paraburkholderia sp. BL6665CI2N2]|uniref:glycosyltransferase family 9 protein n=1 Tax=Paraburkholderia sp. BL6665CI2N2 TaxID=1938806 RepID=UPI0010D66E9B|nr:glycosyltransferase family 9 protein [Paraburkholderia sp. BL6665CI2N2]TDY25510.1 ADP-heptose:LPS heptosyltransferase [Paraburkholderia sp. BL6665CI2N2]
MKNERGQNLLKRIDLIVGGAFLYALGAFRKKRRLPKDCATVGIFAFAAIGDSILSSIIISELRKLKNFSSVVIFASRSNARIYDLFDGLDEVVVVPLTSPFEAIREIRKYEVDLLIDTSQWPRISAILSAFMRAKFTIGFKTENQFRHYAYDASVEHCDGIHELNNFRNLLRPLGIESTEYPRITKDVHPPGLPFVIGDKYIVFHPWASGTNFAMREWPMECWRNLAGMLIENGYAIVITGGPEDSMRAQQLVDLIGSQKVISVAAKVSLTDVVGIVRQAECIICVNTGIMHLSAMLDTPMISLHGPTNPFRWGPVNKELGVVAVSRREGGMFLNLGFEYPRNAKYVMEKISVASVADVLSEVYSIM